MLYMIKQLLAGHNNESRRNAWLKSILEQIPPGCTLLDAGAGELKNKKYCNHLLYTSQDLCEYNGLGNNVGLQTLHWNTNQIDIISDISQIPISSNSFDVVLCSEVLEHVPDPVDALREIVRVLKPSGKLIITAPFCSLTHFAPYHYSTGFSRYWYEYHLNQHGCRIEAIQPNGGWFDLLAQEIFRVHAVCKSHYCPLVGWVSLLFAIPFYMIISLLAAFDKNSSQLATYGYFVVATKLI